MQTAFSRQRFFSRSVGGYVVVLLWVLRDARRHDLLGVFAAMLTGCALTFICYRWTLARGNR